MPSNWRLKRLRLEIQNHAKKNQNHEEIYNISLVQKQTFINSSNKIKTNFLSNSKDIIPKIIFKKFKYHLNMLINYQIGKLHQKNKIILPQKIQKMYFLTFVIH